MGFPVKSVRGGMGRVLTLLAELARARHRRRHPEWSGWEESARSVDVQSVGGQRALVQRLSGAAAPKLKSCPPAGDSGCLIRT